MDMAEWLHPIPLTSSSCMGHLPFYIFLSNDVYAPSPLFFLIVNRENYSEFSSSLIRASEI